MDAAARSAQEALAEVKAQEARGELILAYDTAQRALDQFPQDVWLKHRAVLVLAKAGATRRAEAEFHRLGLAERIEVDIAALEARIAKDEALTALPEERRERFAHAADIYERVYRGSGDYYPGINVATLRLLAGDLDASRRVASEVLALCDGVREDSYYVLATRAEAKLLLGQTAAAERDLVAAAKTSRDLAARAATRKQLRLSSVPHRASTRRS